MTIIRAIAFLLHFTLIPVAVGQLITYKKSNGLLEDYIIGFFGNLGIFYVLYSIFLWKQNWTTFTEPVRGAFSQLTVTYIIVVCLLLILWIIRLGFFSRVKRNKQLTRKNFTRYEIIYMAVFAVIFSIQAYMVFGYEINEWSYDDYDYVVSSQDTITSDTLSYVNFIDGSLPNIAEKRAVASWITYVAFLAKTSYFEVTTICHTILPVVLLMIAYMSYFYIAKKLFDNRENQLVFMILLSVAYIYGLYSHYSLTFRLLGAIWQGKAVLSVIFMPFFMFYLMDCYKHTDDKKRTLSLIALSIGGSSLTSLSIVNISILSIVVWLVMCFVNKKVVSIKYLLASLSGPIYLGILYMLLAMLQHDMISNEFKYFKLRDSRRR